MAEDAPMGTVTDQVETEDREMGSAIVEEEMEDMEVEDQEDPRRLHWDSILRAPRTSGKLIRSLTSR
jgi:hypothetical protein